MLSDGYKSHVSILTVWFSTLRNELRGKFTCFRMLFFSLSFCFSRFQSHFFLVVIAFHFVHKDCALEESKRINCMLRIAPISYAPVIHMYNNENSVKMDICFCDTVICTTSYLFVNEYYSQPFIVVLYIFLCVNTDGVISHFHADHTHKTKCFMANGVFSHLFAKSWTKSLFHLKAKAY